MPAPLLCALLALTCARAELSTNNEAAGRTSLYRRSIQGAGLSDPRGCVYGGRWVSAGSAVRVRDACLRCECARAALSCARAACAPPPDPPPRRCALLHRKGACCPELHCPDGVKSLELEASARLEESTWDVATPAAPAHACVEEGGVFAAGSALTSRAACEQCFCLAGARRCVRPRCLPPPPGCAPRPAAGACCPSRYYCHSVARNVTTTASPATTARGPHDCEVNGEWVPEGERVSGAGGACTACFCLRARVRCQPLACAPPLHGCTPLLRPGHCCPHQYRCQHPHHDSLASIIPSILDNALVSTRYDERSFRTSSYTQSAPTTNSAPTSAGTAQSSSAAPAPTTKVKRKTNDPPPTTVSHKPIQNATKTSPPATTVTTEPTITTETKPTSTTEASTTSVPLEQTTTEQPEGTVKVIINGTINCTAELSSTPMHAAASEDTDKMQLEAVPRVPVSSGGGVEAQTSSPADIITDRDVSAGFDDDNSFTVNVTSSLRANMSHPLPAAPAPSTPSTQTDIGQPLNISKKTKEDYDYDYTEPTLPPSLPNLKIIPFVAADAVIDDDVPAKDESLTYPMLEREDKFPVYYPSVVAEDHKVAPFATRREDVFSPPRPVFVPARTHSDVSKFPAPPPEPPPPAPTVSRPVTKLPAATSTPGHTIPTPAVNLFSPPVETEGGFIPKGPGIIDEYYAVYPSTPPPVPHLTTSMQINPTNPKSECVTADGRRVPAGGAVWLGCSVCACAWAELTCAPRACASVPPGCRRRAAGRPSHDLCCGDIVCDNDNTTTPAPTLSTRRTEITLNVTKIPIEIDSGLIPFDPPPDRAVPTTTEAASTKEKSQENKDVEMNTLHETSSSNQSAESNTPQQSTTAAGEIIKETTTVKTTTITTSTVKPITSSTITTPAPTPDTKETNDTASQSQEYEDEEDDEGFSFGNVLKLLLSDSYDSTTKRYEKKPSTTTRQPPATSTTVTAAPAVTSSFKPLPTPAQVPFIPIQPHPYIPQKKLVPQSTVNRIDHLVLGEATAIKRPTVLPVAAVHQPTPAAPRPAVTPPRRVVTRPTTQRPATSIKPVTSTEAPRPAPSVGGGGGGGGLLKLAGCNIYGRMYRVGRIIAELSTPCQECRCTELGVQCAPLRC